MSMPAHQLDGVGCTESEVSEVSGACVCAAWDVGAGWVKRRGVSTTAAEGTC